MQTKDGIRPTAQTIIFAAIDLEDDRALADYNIHPRDIGTEPAGKIDKRNDNLQRKKKTP